MRFSKWQEFNTAFMEVRVKDRGKARKVDRGHTLKGFVGQIEDLEGLYLIGKGRFWKAFA